MKSTSERISSYKEPKMVLIERYNKKVREARERRKKERENRLSLLPKSKRVKLGRPKTDDPKVIFPSFWVKGSKMKKLIEKYSKAELRIKAAELIEML